MNLENLQRVIERNTLLLMYEPGAGGDFVAALLSVDPKINGTSSKIEFHQNGRIKAVKEKRNLFVNNVIDDYEFYQNEPFFDNVKTQLIEDVLGDIVASYGKFISKLHPYFNDRTNLPRLIEHINHNYKNSSKIMLLRDRDTCMLNHIAKNNTMADEIYYNNEWYDMYEELRSNHTDILSVKFSDILTNPIHTLSKIYHIMGYTESEITHNFSINNDKLKYIYNTYIDNQTNLENVERYWQ